MAEDPDHDRIAAKAHALWEAAGHPHGRDQDHWDQARELVAIEDSLGDTLLPRDTGAEEPIEEPEQALRNLGDVPNLTDQGENLLTSTDREPDLTATPSGRSGQMPTAEVPISDQPGIPEQAKAAPAAQSPSMPAPAAPEATPPKAANTPKRGKPDAIEAPPRRGGPRKKGN